MQYLFKTGGGFTLVYMVLLVFDVIWTNDPGMYWYSFTTKALLLVAGLQYFMGAGRYQSSRVRFLVVSAMLCFVFGTAFITASNDLNVIASGFLLLLAAKVLYIAVLVYRADLDIDKMLPYLVFVTLYSLTVIYFLYDIPEHIPAYIFLVVTLIVLMLAYLRYGMVGSRSFLLAFLGGVTMLAGDTVLVFERTFFSEDLSGIAVISLYGLTQYFLLTGIKLQSPKSTSVWLRV